MQVYPVHELGSLSSSQYLQEEKFLCDLLDELLRNILREELCSELELQRILLLDILLGHLEGTPEHKPSSSALYKVHVTWKSWEN